MQDCGSALFSPHSFTTESGQGTDFDVWKESLGKMTVMLHKGNVRENKGLLKKEYLFLAQFSHNIHHSPRSWRSASVFLTEQSRPHHCHLPPSLVSEFPFLISFYFLVPSSICVFPLVKFLPPFQLLWRIPCLHCLNAGKDVSETPIPDFFLEQTLLEKSAFFDFGWSTWGEDGAHISLVPGKNCEGTEHVQSLSVDEQCLLRFTAAALRNLHVHLKDGMYGDISS